MAAPDLRSRLIVAAEELFGLGGVDSVSLREINAAAGAGNASAIQYHFGDRAGLVRAVLAQHDPDVESRRHALLDQYEADERGPDLRTLAGVLVRPFAAELDCGPGYLQLRADLINQPRPVIDPATLDDKTESLNRWRFLIEPLLSPEALRMHRRFIALRFTLTELARRTREPSRDNRLFVSHLIDLVTALLAAEVSGETSRHFDETRHSPQHSLSQ